ncbi:hypothetical protein CANARDRAFT_21354 [[Candida] arabinofermentans NRRL YB-2248]|uniref:Uncharacterized protein n=1 Tax=[Candida] arabinofermentans NRRL YB-2248 TaxID=983967 RepID=A0A1E4T6L1_9ASCO|nr:hypothetical protein CANARDRAFT_21354 [[Candida] arabinofermentans NRRL YB-2248]
MKKSNSSKKSLWSQLKSSRSTSHLSSSKVDAGRQSMLTRSSSMFKLTESSHSNGSASSPIDEEKLTEEEASNPMTPITSPIGQEISSSGDLLRVDLSPESSFAYNEGDDSEFNILGLDDDDDDDDDNYLGSNDKLLSCAFDDYQLALRNLNIKGVTTETPTDTNEVFDALKKENNIQQDSNLKKQQHIHPGESKSEDSFQTSSSSSNSELTLISQNEPKIKVNLKETNQFIMIVEDLSNSGSKNINDVKTDEKNNFNDNDLDDHFYGDEEEEEEENYNGSFIFDDLDDLFDSETISDLDQQHSSNKFTTRSSTSTQVKPGIKRTSLYFT